MTDTTPAIVTVPLSSEEPAELAAAPAVQETPPQEAQPPKKRRGRPPKRQDAPRTVELHPVQPSPPPGPSPQEIGAVAELAEAATEAYSGFLASKFPAVRLDGEKPGLPEPMKDGIRKPLAQCLLLWGVTGSPEIALAIAVGMPYLLMMKAQEMIDEKRRAEAQK